jgi:glycerol uptake facilitator-like aquaporin
MGERLSGASAWQTLLVNSLATGTGLVALILAFGPLSGAQFNPVVTLVDAALGHRPRRELPAYLGAQIVGAFCGVAAAHGMFGAPLFSASHRARGGPSQILAELVATIGLLAVVFASSRSGPRITAFAVGCYITAAYWFTASTSFANPAVTLARSMTDTFAGIRLADVPGFLIAQLTGAAGVALLFRWLILPRPARRSD